MIVTVPVKIPKIFKGIHLPYRYKVFYGGRGSGKSQSVARYLLLAGKEQKLKILCAREYQTSIKESVKQLLEELIQELKMEDFYKVQTGEIIGVNGTSFIFAGLHHNIANIKSMHDVNKCWVEEAQVVSDFSWSILIPTIRAEGSEIILTLNPELEEDPTYQRFIADPPPNALIVKVNYTDNPYFTSVLEAEKELLKRKNYEAYLHIWEGKPLAAVEGAIYSIELQKARDSGRIGKFRYDDRYPVSCFWDLGWADNTSIWFLQVINHEFRVIDAYQSQFQKTPHYVQILQERKYRYDRIVLPHDAEAEHANADRTWLQIVRAAFPNVKVYAGKRQAIETRLEATKNMFGLISIDKEHCTDGLNALARYHYAVDPTTGKSTREPFHGPESNYADAFGYMCLEMVEQPKPRAPTHNRPSIIRRSGIYQ